VCENPKREKNGEILYSEDESPRSIFITFYMEKKFIYACRLFSYLTVMGYELNFAGKSSKDCGAPCNSPFFDESERTTLRYWISSWAAVTAICCLFTVST